MSPYPSLGKPVEPVHVLSGNSRSRANDFSMAKIVVIENRFEERPVII
jgi:hypothetical protein